MGHLYEKSDYYSKQNDLKHMTDKNSFKKYDFT
jgi:hypothetical protein